MNTLVRLGLALCLIATTEAVTAAPALSPRLYAEGFSQPVAIANAGDGSGRLFVVEKTGLVRIVRGGTVALAPFLDLSDRISTSGERGLLGLAFHPNYAQNGRFFVYYTRVEDGAIRVSGFRVQAGNPDRGDSTTEQSLLVVPHPGADNHNGGNLAFGPDGHLYLGTGDGGGSGDPNNNAQNDGVMLGKLIRVDVDAASPVIEPWAKGLRNPWKFSFDRATGDLFIGDVGQNRFEEVNYTPAGIGPGRNYGWRVVEGTACFNPSTGCNPAGMVSPFITYGRDLGQAVTGGYVYRGLKSRELYGYYVYGDFQSNRVWAARQVFDGWSNEQVVTPGVGPSGISSFGEDESGELYLASLNNGRIYALDGAATARFDQGVVSGLWWNAGESGWGAQFTQRGTIVFAAIYNYGPDGMPKWYLSSDCAVTTSGTTGALSCEGGVYEATGPRFFGAAFDPSAVHTTRVGTLRITWKDSEHASMHFEVGSIARDVTLTRQVFRSRALAPVPDATDIYYSATEPGWGLTVQHQGDVYFVAWYVYDEAGKPVWYIASSCNVTGNGCAGSLYRVTGPPLATTFDSTRIVTTPVGNIQIGFSNANDATLTYTVNGVSGSKAITRFRF